MGLGDDAQVEVRGPLTGIRIVELASVVMGPYATQILGDLGAEIVKVEPPTGDLSRFMGKQPHPDLSGIAINLHRNKRSIVLDLKQRLAQEALRRLLETADALVTNLRPSSLSEFGIEYEALVDANPRLIYCDTHGFRTDSQEADEPAFDDTIQAHTGYPSLFGDMGLETRFMPILIADKVTGLTIVYALLAALYERERSGVGQRVEVPMFDTMLAFNFVEHLCQAVIPGEPAGYQRALSINRGPHETRDGWVAVMPYTNRHWRALYEAAGKEELLEAPYHKDMPTRLVQADLVYGELKTVLRERTTDEWLEICHRTDVPVAPVRRLSEIVDDPALHRGVLRETTHPAIGTYRQIAPPTTFSRTPLRELADPAPLLGEHTVEILAELGLDADEIAEVTQSKQAAEL